MSRTTERGATLVEMLIAAGLTGLVAVFAVKIFLGSRDTLGAADAKQEAIEDIKAFAAVVKKTYTMRTGMAGPDPRVIVLNRPDRTDASKTEQHQFIADCVGWGAKAGVEMRGSHVKLSTLQFPMNFGGVLTGCVQCPTGQRPIVRHVLNPAVGAPVERRYPAAGSDKGLAGHAVGMTFCAKQTGASISLSVRGFYFNPAGRLERTVEHFNLAPSVAAGGSVQIAPVTPGVDICPAGVTTGC
jgi:hypothetical protein